MGKKCETMVTPSDSFYKYIAQTSDFPLAMDIDRAEGIYLYTKEGEKCIDFISGIAVSSLGHRHPEVVKAIKDQVDKHLHVMVYGEMVQEPQIKFAELLIQNLPEQFDQVYLVNSGTEANEGALKLAKKYTGRSKLVAFRNSYHGDTHGSLSVTGRDIYRDPYLPLLEDVHFLDFNSDEGLSVIDEHTAAVILEPIQGEGGVIPARQAWLEEVRLRTTKAGALLIFDEIQSGFFRTGPFFAFEHYQVIPDILCMAKAMGGGMPIGGFAASTSIFQTFKYDPPLNHVTTFGGHPVSCAAAYANLKVLLDGGYGTKAAKIEELARKYLTGEGIVEVRGKGAMLGLQLRDQELTQKTVEDCFKNNILLGWTLHSDTLIRLAPPLIIDEEVLISVFEQIKSSISKYV